MNICSLLFNATLYHRLITSLFICIFLSNCGGNKSPSNTAPSAVASADANTYQSGDLVTLIGSQSSDNESAISFQWQQLSGPSQNLDTQQSSTASFTAPTVSEDTELRFQLTVTDDSNLSDSAIINITISPAASRLGLDSRPENTTCIAQERPTGDASVRLNRAFNNLPQFNLPVALRMDPDANNWYVLEQAGRILRFSNSANPNSTAVFADLRSLVDDGNQESGLLAIAFHPNFANNGFVYLFYQTRINGTQYTMLSRFTSNDGGLSLDTNSRQDLIQLDPPFGNHYGGELGFGRDGFLYLSIGDGGSGGDPGNRAQNNQNLFGAIVRLNVDSASPYSIPLDNPFSGNALCSNGLSSSGEDCPEIYAYGLRNVWRWSFDAVTGQLWAGDVGQDAWEEINLIENGGNYGWRIKEATHCFNPRTNCSSAGLIDPVAEIQHPSGESITGGYVYRGASIPSLTGRYIFGDYQSGRLWALLDDDGGGLAPQEIASTGLNVASFALGEDNELYILSYGDGRIYRMDPVDNAESSNFPERLSETGCVLAEDPTTVAPNMISYSINAPFWSDGAEKNRWFALPPNEMITVTNDGQWEFPVGSVLLKDFKLNNKLIETRLFMHHTDGRWGGYSYAWNDEQTDAYLVKGGALEEKEGQDWIFPSGAQCMTCHTAVAGRTLGPTSAQLNKQHRYEVTGRTAAQLETLSSIGLLSQNPNIAALPWPEDEAIDVNQRARAYLESNCAQCHQPNGPTDVDIDFRFTTSLANMNICNVAVQNNDLGLPNPSRLVPGSPEQSLLLERMSRRDAHGMPPLGSSLLDLDGIALISQWIQSLNNCQ